MVAGPPNQRSPLDRVGACASTICAVHCLLTGLALGLLSVGWLGFLANPILEGVFLGVAVLIGTFAVVHGVRRHGSYRPAVLFAIGLTAIVVAQLLHARYEMTLAHGLLSATGGVFLVLFHLMNQRMARHG